MISEVSVSDHCPEKVKEVKESDGINEVQRLPGLGDFVDPKKIELVGAEEASKINGESDVEKAPLMDIPEEIVKDKRVESTSIIEASDRDVPDVGRAFGIEADSGFVSDRGDEKIECKSKDEPMSERLIGTEDIILRGDEEKSEIVDKSPAKEVESNRGDEPEKIVNIAKQDREISDVELIKEQDEAHDETVKETVNVPETIAAVADKSLKDAAFEKSEDVGGFPAEVTEEKTGKGLESEPKVHVETECTENREQPETVDELPVKQVEATRERERQFSEVEVKDDVPGQSTLQEVNKEEKVEELPSVEEKEAATEKAIELNEGYASQVKDKTESLTETEPTEKLTEPIPQQSSRECEEEEELPLKEETIIEEREVPKSGSKVDETSTKQEETKVQLVEEESSKQNLENDQIDEETTRQAKVKDSEAEHIPHDISESVESAEVIDSPEEKELLPNKPEEVQETNGKLEESNVEMIDEQLVKPTKGESMPKLSETQDEPEKIFNIVEQDRNIANVELDKEQDEAKVETVKDVDEPERTVAVAEQPSKDKIFEKLEDVEGAEKNVETEFAEIREQQEPVKVIGEEKIGNVDDLPIQEIVAIEKQELSKGEVVEVKDDFFSEQSVSHEVGKEDKVAELPAEEENESAKDESKLSELSVQPIIVDEQKQSYIQEKMDHVEEVSSKGEEIKDDKVNTSEPNEGIDVLDEPLDKGQEEAQGGKTESLSETEPAEKLVEPFPQQSSMELDKVGELPVKEVTAIEEEEVPKIDSKVEDSEGHTTAKQEEFKVPLVEEEISQKNLVKDGNFQIGEERTIQEEVKKDSEVECGPRDISNSFESGKILDSPVENFEESREFLPENKQHIVEDKLEEVPETKVELEESKVELTEEHPVEPTKRNYMHEQSEIQDEDEKIFNIAEQDREIAHVEPAKEQDEAKEEMVDEPERMDAVAKKSSKDTVFEDKTGRGSQSQPEEILETEVAEIQEQPEPVKVVGGEKIESIDEQPVKEAESNGYKGNLTEVEDAEKQKLSASEGVEVKDNDNEQATLHEVDKKEKVEIPAEVEKDNAEDESKLSDIKPFELIENLSLQPLIVDDPRQSYVEEKLDHMEEFPSKEEEIKVKDDEVTVYDVTEKLDTISEPKSAELLVESKAPLVDEPKVEIEVSDKSLDKGKEEAQVDTKLIASEIKNETERFSEIEAAEKLAEQMPQQLSKELEKVEELPVKEVTVIGVEEVPKTESKVDEIAESDTTPKQEEPNAHLVKEESYEQNLEKDSGLLGQIGEETAQEEVKDSEAEGRNRDISNLVESEKVIDAAAENFETTKELSPTATQPILEDVNVLECKLEEVPETNYPGKLEESKAELIEEQPLKLTKTDDIPEQSEPEKTEVREIQVDEILGTKPAEKLEESKVETLETTAGEANQVSHAEVVQEIDRVPEKTELKSTEEKIDLPTQSLAKDVEKKIGIVENLPENVEDDSSEREITEIKSVEPIVEEQKQTYSEEKLNRVEEFPSNEEEEFKDNEATVSKVQDKLNIKEPITAELLVEPKVSLVEEKNNEPNVLDEGQEEKLVHTEVMSLEVKDKIESLSELPVKEVRAIEVEVPKISSRVDEILESDTAAKQEESKVQLIAEENSLQNLEKDSGLLAVIGEETTQEEVKDSEAECRTRDISDSIESERVIDLVAENFEKTKELPPTAIQPILDDVNVLESTLEEVPETNYPGNLEETKTDLIEEQPLKLTKTDDIQEQSETENTAVHEIQVDEILGTKPAEKLEESKVKTLETTAEEANQVLHTKVVQEIDQVPEKTELKSAEEEIDLPTKFLAKDVEKKIGIVENLPENVEDNTSEKEITEIKSVEPITEKPIEGKDRDYMQEQSEPEKVELPVKEIPVTKAAEKLEESEVEALETIVVPEQSLVGAVDNKGIGEELFAREGETKQEEENQFSKAEVDREIPEDNEIQEQNELLSLTKDVEKNIVIDEGLLEKVGDYSSEREIAAVGPAELEDVTEKSSLGSFDSKLEKGEELIANETETTEKGDTEIDPESDKLETISESAPPRVHEPDGQSTVTEHSEKELSAPEQLLYLDVKAPVDQIELKGLSETEETIEPEAQLNENSEKKDVVEVKESAMNTEFTDAPLEDKIFEPENIGVETTGEKTEEEQCKQKPTEDTISSIPTSETQIDEKISEKNSEAQGEEYAKTEKQRETNEDKQCEPKPTEDVAVSLPTSQTQDDKNTLENEAEREESAKKIEDIDIDNPLEVKILEQEKIVRQSEEHVEKTEEQFKPKHTEDAADSIQTSENEVDENPEGTDAVEEQESGTRIVNRDAPLEDQIPAQKNEIETKERQEKSKEEQCELKPAEDAASFIPTSEPQSEEKFSQKTELTEDDSATKIGKEDAPLKEKIPKIENIGAETEDPIVETEEQCETDKSTEDATRSIPAFETRVDSNCEKTSENIVDVSEKRDEAEEESSKQTSEISDSLEDEISGPEKLGADSEDVGEKNREEQRESKHEDAASFIPTTETHVEEEISEKTKSEVDKESANQTLNSDAPFEDKIPGPDTFGKENEEQWEPKTLEDGSSSMPTSETQIGEISKENDTEKTSENEIPRPEKISEETNDGGAKTANDESNLPETKPRESIQEFFAQPTTVDDPKQSSVVDESKHLEESPSKQEEEIKDKESTVPGVHDELDTISQPKSEELQAEPKTSLVNEKTNEGIDISDKSLNKNQDEEQANTSIVDTEVEYKPRSLANTELPEELAEWISEQPLRELEKVAVKEEAEEEIPEIGSKVDEISENDEVVKQTEPEVQLADEESLQQNLEKNGGFLAQLREETVQTEIDSSEKSSSMENLEKRKDLIPEKMQVEEEEREEVSEINTPGKIEESKAELIEEREIPDKQVDEISPAEKLEESKYECSEEENRVSEEKAVRETPEIDREPEKTESRFVEEKVDQLPQFSAENVEEKLVESAELVSAKEAGSTEEKEEKNLEIGSTELPAPKETVDVEAPVDQTERANLMKTEEPIAPEAQVDEISEKDMVIDAPVEDKVSEPEKIAGERNEECDQSSNEDAVSSILTSETPVSVAGEESAKNQIPESEKNGVETEDQEKKKDDEQYEPKPTDIAEGGESADKIEDTEAFSEPEKTVAETEDHGEKMEEQCKPKLTEDDDSSIPTSKNEVDENSEKTCVEEEKESGVRSLNRDAPLEDQIQDPEKSGTETEDHGGKNEDRCEPKVSEDAAISIPKEEVLMETVEIGARDQVPEPRKVDEEEEDQGEKIKEQYPPTPTADATATTATIPAPEAIVDGISQKKDVAEEEFSKQTVETEAPLEEKILEAGKIGEETEKHGGKAEEEVEPNNIEVAARYTPASITRAYEISEENDAVMEEEICREDDTKNTPEIDAPSENDISEPGKIAGETQDRGLKTEEQCDEEEGISEKTDEALMESSDRTVEVIAPLNDQVPEQEKIVAEAEDQGEKIEEQSPVKPAEKAASSIPTTDTIVDDISGETSVPLEDRINEEDKIGVEAEERGKNEEERCEPETAKVAATSSIPTPETEVDEVGSPTKEEQGERRFEDVAGSIPSSETQVEEKLSDKTGVAEGEESAKETDEIDAPLEKIHDPERIGVETKDGGEKMEEERFEPETAKVAATSSIPTPETEVDEVGSPTKEEQGERRFEDVAGSIPASETQVEEKLSDKTRVADGEESAKETGEIDASVEKILDLERIGVETKDGGEKTEEERFEPETTGVSASSFPTSETLVEEEISEKPKVVEDGESAQKIGTETEDKGEKTLVEDSAISIPASEALVEEEVSEKAKVVEDEESAQKTVDFDAPLEDNILKTQKIGTETEDRGEKTEERSEPETTEDAALSIPTSGTQVEEISDKTNIAEGEESAKETSEIDAHLEKIIEPEKVGAETKTREEKTEEEEDFEPKSTEVAASLREEESTEKSLKADAASESKICEPEKISVRAEDTGANAEGEPKPTDGAASSSSTSDPQVDEFSEKDNTVKEEESAKKTSWIDPILEDYIPEPQKTRPESEDQGTKEVFSAIPVPEITERSPVSEVTFRDIKQVEDNRGKEEETAKEKAVDGIEDELMNRESEKTESAQKTEEIVYSLKEKLDQEKQEDKASITDVKNTESIAEPEEEAPAKSPHKHSNNIIKMVKHSLGKAKKAIIGKSTHSKTSEKKGDEVSK